jgi:predicted glutamine amidotransferase
MKKEVHNDAPSLYNLVLTDGKAMIATRYSTRPELETRSLHIASHAKCYTGSNGFLKLDPETEDEKAILISSEVLTEDRKYWTEVPENHCITVEEDLSVDIKPLV